MSSQPNPIKFQPLPNQYSINKFVRNIINIISSSFNGCMFTQECNKHKNLTDGCGQRDSKIYCGMTTLYHERMLLNHVTIRPKVVIFE